jgi:hypothetical protein
MICSRCKIDLPKDTEEYCWFCDGPLCATCWDDFGHCGHPEAETIDESLKTKSVDERARVFAALWPDAEQLVSTKKSGPVS